jgi:hypothetical protein
MTVLGTDINKKPKPSQNEPKTDFHSPGSLADLGWTPKVATRKSRTSPFRISRLLPLHLQPLVLKNAYSWYTSLRLTSLNLKVPERVILVQLSERDKWKSPKPNITGEEYTNTN